jgi:tRNA threonylcarbamoyl adenosine modification protein YeaZ
VVILAIDTTTRGGSVAVTRDDELLALVGGDVSRTHGERVPGEIAQALEQAGLSKSAIDLIAVAAGPGAFTGLRIGLATAQGLALTLDRPAVGVSALDALAWTVVTAVDDKPEGLSPRPGDLSPQPEDLSPQTASWRQTFRFVEPSGNAFVAPWMDAQRGDVFAALYRVDSGRPMSDEPWAPWTVVERAVTARPRVVLESWTTTIGAAAECCFIGDAARRDGGLIAEVGKGRWRAQEPEALASAIASLGRRLALAGHAGKPHLLTPIYVRRPDAEIERERRRLS